MNPPPRGAERGFHANTPTEDNPREILSRGRCLSLASERDLRYNGAERSRTEGIFMRIEHIALYVNDLERARDFFVNYLGGVPNDGYHNVKTGFRSYFIAFDDGARLEVMSRPGVTDAPKGPDRTGWAHAAFSVGSAENVDKLTARLKADGYEVISGPRTTGDGYYESCIAVVEGNQIEIAV